MAPSALPMITSVVRAFFHSGFRKAGTPLLMASTPVTAAPPEAKACMTTNTDAPIRSPLPPWPRGSMPGFWTRWVGRLPEAILARPMPSSTIMLTMKKYVGMAKIRPDSFTPRRLP